MKDQGIGSTPFAAMFWPFDGANSSLSAKAFRELVLLWEKCPISTTRKDLFLKIGPHRPEFKP